MVSSLRNMFTRVDKSSLSLFHNGDPWALMLLGLGRHLELTANWFSISERFPDLNPIENLFNLVRKELNKQALSRNISTESFQEFLIHTKLKMN